MQEIDADGSGEIEFAEFDAIFGKWIRNKLASGLHAALAHAEEPNETFPETSEKTQFEEEGAGKGKAPAADAQKTVSKRLQHVEAVQDTTRWDEAVVHRESTTKRRIWDGWDTYRCTQEKTRQQHSDHLAC